MAATSSQQRQAAVNFDFSPNKSEIRKRLFLISRYRGLSIIFRKLYPCFIRRTWISAHLMCVVLRVFSNVVTLELLHSWCGSKLELILPILSIAKELTVPFS